MLNFMTALNSQIKEVLKMRRMNITGLLLLLTLIPFYVPDLSAQTHFFEQRETLRGLKGIQVLVEPITLAGLTESTLKTDVELKLRKAGIRVLTKDEWLLTQGYPYLYVNVTAIELKSPQEFIYSVNVGLTEDVILSRNRSIETSATTWKKSALGITPDLRAVREAVGDQVDKFMNDYLAVNPK